ncbi:TMEM175 family protein [Streptococcus sciuri]|uniref:TMEM175 family protein n=1 Tax=Streptococcus sciuri TaxID=2973939 RepID=A0ABT2F7E7_9STRE|nr:TMEM175 family protein [Streptococcus sciuri]MCS4488416.1 TMEM175 family protein [Streptococcus sciuri]
MEAENQRQEQLENFVKHTQEEFKQLYPELQELSEEEALEVRKELIKEQEKENASRLKEHLEVFSDAVIAVIATVMLLEIPTPSHEDNLHNFLYSILIFFVTFFVIADMWWDNHKNYNQVDSVSPKVVITQIFFMASMALLPVFTRWMMEDTTRIAVISYGVVLVVTNFFQWLIEYFVSQERFAQTIYVKSMLKRMSYMRLISATIISFFIIAMSFVNPYIAFLFYILSPIVSFVHSLNSRRNPDIGQRLMAFREKRR